MAGKDDKWVMFKNYMHNELGITKEDIREWIDNSVEEQVRLVLDNTFKNIDLRDIICREVRKTLERYEIKEKIAEKVINSIRFENP